MEILTNFPNVLGLRCESKNFNIFGGCLPFPSKNIDALVYLRATEGN